MFSLLLCNIYLHKWKDPAPQAQANSTIWGPPLRQAHWILPGQLSTLHLWDETLVDSSLLNKAPSKGGGKEGTKREDPSPKWVTIGQRNKSMWDLFWERLVRDMIIIMGGRKTKECAPKGLETWLSTWMDCLFLPLKTQCKIPTHPPTNHLHSLFTFGFFAKW